ncbi:unnamed protein product [Nippostrongylus brasiliensis]|uniref:Probable G-protein coupled receptor (inferred by orthology to a C. elegans protein) n=1 Tax=Nippostrongylus brasiliensis TaxID=27835 RepID=A0A158R200_NIPBR|nr:unnamed protein product [Nippostrongylus brasiliensis]
MVDPTVVGSGSKNKSFLSLNRSHLLLDDREGTEAVHYLFSFLAIAAWTAGVISYAMLGLNRCIAICYYGTKAKTLNRVSVAIGLSLSTWIIGLAAALAGTIPEPLIAIRRDMWSVSFVTIQGERPALFFTAICSIDCIGIGVQWICSTLVLRKIQQVKRKICSNKLNQNSANRFRKQARLTFQFFYPSVLCTFSTFLYFIKPYLYHAFTPWQMILLHIIWLCSHVCNPFIYAYFNDRMRHTYREMLSCTTLRYHLRKRRRNNLFGRGRHNVSKWSRDFEQLCEFIMRVNPLYDSSEGWRESSEDESVHQVCACDSHSAILAVQHPFGRRTTVLELRSQFPKKKGVALVVVDWKDAKSYLLSLVEIGPILGFLFARS